MRLEQNGSLHFINRLFFNVDSSPAHTQDESIVGRTSVLCAVAEFSWYPYVRTFHTITDCLRKRISNLSGNVVNNSQRN